MYHVNRSLNYGYKLKKQENLVSLNRKWGKSGRIYFDYLPYLASAVFGSLLIYQYQDICPEMKERVESVSTMEEKISKKKFPTMLEAYENESSVHWLLGVSIRCMMGLCSLSYARAYSYGIYVSQKGLQSMKEETLLGLELTPESVANMLLPTAHVFDKELSQPLAFIPSESYVGNKIGYMYKEGKGYELQNREAAEKVGPSYPCAMLRLIMLRDVKCSHVARGFDTTFRRRLREEHKKHTDACASFLEVINSDKAWKEGTILDFLRLPDGRVEISINGEVRRVIESEALSFALFDAYLGKNGHLSKAAKEAFVERCKEVVRVLET